MLCKSPDSKGGISTNGIPDREDDAMHDFSLCSMQLPVRFVQASGFVSCGSVKGTSMYTTFAAECSGYFLGPARVGTLRVQSSVLAWDLCSLGI